MNIIIEEIRKGETLAFKRFFDTNYADLVLSANQFLYDLSASEDLVQEAFLYLWENAHRLEVTGSLRSYLYVMVKNRCLNFLQSLKLTDELNTIENNIHLITDHPFEEATREEQRALYFQVLKTMDQLPEKMQQAAKMKFLYHYKYKEIAEELNISESTVKTHLKRAKKLINESVVILLLLMRL